jgi:phosphoglycerate dehydrogenase-like enzyme
MKVLLRHKYGDDRIAFLKARLADHWRVEDMETPDDRDALQAALTDADAVVSMSWRDTFPRPDGLKLIQLPGAGYDSVDFSALPDGAAVCNVFEHEIGISEYLLLAMLEWQIRLSRMHASMLEDRWVGGFVGDFPLHGELFGKTVGFVGYGRISRETAKRLKAFNVKILACTRTPSKRDENVDEITGMDGLHAMLSRSDFVVVACPLTDETHGLIDAAALEALGPDGVILNVARGRVLDEDALWEACSEKRIAGAVIDTWYQYPRGGSTTGAPSRHPFATLDNVIMSPHASGWSEGLLDRRWTLIAENLTRLERGEPLLNLLREPGGPGPT